MMFWDVPQLWTSLSSQKRTVAHGLDSFGKREKEAGGLSDLAKGDTKVDLEPWKMEVQICRLCWILAHRWSPPGWTGMSFRYVLVTSTSDFEDICTNKGMAWCLLFVTSAFVASSSLSFSYKLHGCLFLAHFPPELSHFLLIQRIILTIFLWNYGFPHCL